MSSTRSSCNKRIYESAPLAEEKPKRSWSSKKGVKKSARGEETIATLSTTLANHIAVATPFIVELFRSKKDVKGSLCMWDTLAGTVWQENVDVCCAALECGVNVYKLACLDLFRNVGFFSKAFLCTKNQQQAQELWSLIETKLQENSTVAFAALDRGAVAFSNLPKTIRDNKKCLLVGLRQGEFKWKALPKRYKRDVDFALSACGQDRSVFTYACDIVTDKEKLWREWACKNPAMSFRYRTAPDSITSDPILMQEVISCDPSVAKYLHGSLAKDYNFVQTVLKGNLDVLPYFPRSTYSHFPSIVNVETVTKYCDEGYSFYCSKKSKITLLQRIVPAQHWADRSFVLGWCSVGGSIHNDISKPLLDDEEVVLMYVRKHEKPSYNSRFKLVSERLRSDKVIVRQFLESFHPDRVFDSLPRALREDNALRVFACAKNREYSPFISDSGMRRRFLVKLRSRLNEYEGFFKGVLCGSAASSGGPLALLNTGPDILRVIASFLDFPIGEELGFLFQAAIHLNVYGFNPYRWNRDDGK